MPSDGIHQVHSPLNTGSPHCPVSPASTFPTLATHPVLTTPLKDMSQSPTQLADSTIQKQQELPIDQWDSNDLLKFHLKNTGEPSPDRPLDVVVLKARAMVLKSRIRELERSQTVMAPRHNETIDTELAGTRFKRKILLWLTFPINSLPAEILTSIFHLVLNLSEGPQQAVMHRLHLTWVCGCWRDVVISDKMFWNIVWFRDRPPYTRSLAWIDRAGMAPLEVRINEMFRRPGDTEDPPRVTKEQMDALLDRLLTKVATIRTMVIVVDTWPAALSVLQKTCDAGTPESLERFELHRAGSPYSWTPVLRRDPEAVTPIAFFGGAAPRLQWLVIDGVSIDWMQSPLSNLTTLDLRRMAMHACPTLDRWREILMECPRLYRLSLDASGPQWLPSGSLVPPPVPMPFLRDLFIGDFSVAYAMYILSQISAPGLRCLTMMNFTGEDFGPFAEFLVGRFPDLRILALYNVHVPPSVANTHKLVRWLDTLSRLQYLKVSQVAPAILRAFLEDPRDHRPRLLPDDDEEEESREVLCPELRSMTFHFQDMLSLLTMTEGRQSLGVPFKKVYGLPSVSLLDTVQLAKLRASIGTFEPLRPIYGAYTAEEKAIHHEMLVSSGQHTQPLYCDLLR